MLSLTVNGQRHRLDVDPEMPLLWVLRDVLGLTGTKYGCGIAQCGACTVHLNGAPAFSCLTPVSAAEGKSVVTIEGLAHATGLHRIQQAWLDEEVAQCGYCQPGQIMGAVALLAEFAHPTDAEIEAAMDRSLCRCGTYARVRAAIHRAASQKPGGDRR
jgi:isoquinoline 1-oxidoreductase alpha subunit